MGTKAHSPPWGEVAERSNHLYRDNHKGQRTPSIIIIVLKLWQRNWEGALYVQKGFLGCQHRELAGIALPILIQPPSWISWFFDCCWKSPKSEAPNEKVLEKYLKCRFLFLCRLTQLDPFVFFSWKCISQISEPLLAFQDSYLTTISSDLLSIRKQIFPFKRIQV